MLAMSSSLRARAPGSLALPKGSNTIPMQSIYLVDRGSASGRKADAYQEDTFRFEMAA